MRGVGTPSWEFRESIDHQLHLALFVREAAGLEVPPDASVPPRLLHPVESVPDLLGAVGRKAAATQWLSWWRELLVAETDRSGGHSGAAEHHRRGPQWWFPEFREFADRPALRLALQTHFESAARWVHGAPRPAAVREVPKPLFAFDLVRSTAEDVAFDRQVSVASVRGSALVLNVVGEWRRLIAPGVVLCSTALTRDRRNQQIVLREVFESAVRTD